MAGAGGTAIGWHGLSALGVSPGASLLGAALVGGLAAGVTAMSLPDSMPMNARKAKPSPSVTPPDKLLV